MRAGLCGGLRGRSTARRVSLRTHKPRFPRALHRRAVIIIGFVIMLRLEAALTVLSGLNDLLSTVGAWLPPVFGLLASKAILLGLDRRPSFAFWIKHTYTILSFLILWIV